MPITTLDPVTALVVIDLQQGIVGMPLAHPIASVVGNAAQLARAFRARNLPVVLVNVAGVSPGRTEGPRFSMASLPPTFAELVPELDRQPTDHLVTKLSIGAFYGTALELHLRRAGATQIVLCGVATGSGVEATARAAHDAGFHLTFALDAMTDRSAEVHGFFTTQVFPRIGETGTTADVIAKLG